MQERGLDLYQKRTQEIVDGFRFNWPLYVQYIHLVEEVAELGEALTVRQGDRAAGSGEAALADHSDPREEIGDVLFSVLAVANLIGVSAPEALDRAFERYRGKLERLAMKERP